MMVFPVLLVALMLVGVGDAGKLTYEAIQAPDGIVCPNGVSKCSSDHTCCKLGGGEWGCCPFARATCCSDSVHCCPQGYSCDGSKQRCIQAINNDTVPWAKKQQAPASSAQATPPENGLMCPNGAFCNAGAACCRTYTGTYRCCNYPHNVCCSDGYHCCARCSICDLHGWRCIPALATSEWEVVAPTKSTATISDGAAPASSIDDE